MRFLRQLPPLPALLLLVWTFCPDSAALAREYIINKSESSLRFTAIQQGIEFEGRFENFEATIIFDPADLSSSTIRASVDLASVDTRSPDRDAYLLNELWFNVAAWPTAVFEARDFRRHSDQEYLADAFLTLRNVTGPVQMQFQFESTPGGEARLTGTVPLMRLDFGIGQGDWTDTSWIGNPVNVLIDLELKPADGNN